MMQGVDVAVFQGSIDWQKARAAGIEFAMIRAGTGIGQNGKFEPNVRKNIEGCIRAGVHIGLWWFSYAGTPEQAIQEADECIAIADEYRGYIDFPLAYDLEYDSDVYQKRDSSEDNDELRTQLVEAFCHRVEQAGYYAINYSNWDYLINHYKSERLLGVFDLWEAAPYQQGPTFEKYAGIWQYDWHGRVPGIPAEVDMDYAYRDYPTIIREHGLNHLAERPPEPEKPKIQPIVIEVTDEGQRAAIIAALHAAK